MNILCSSFISVHAKDLLNGLKGRIISIVIWASNLHLRGMDFQENSSPYRESKCQHGSDPIGT